MMIYLGVFLVILMFLLSSSHFLMMLLMVELVVLLMFVFTLIQGVSWFMSVMFLLVAVCVGAYGVCLLVSCGRCSGGSYLMTFFV